MTEEAATAGSSLQLTVPEALPGTSDSTRLEQVVANLLSNAIKYGNGKPIRVTLQAEDGIARIVVTDQGIGIAAAAMKRIFDRFERAVSVRHYGGLGLGLYITRQIVEALGGAIEVNSREGEGSTFTVTLPVNAPPPTSPSPPAERSP